MGVVEGLICGRDKEVRRARVKVITKGRDVHITRPVQKLYPIEVHAGPNAGKRQDKSSATNRFAREQSASQSDCFGCG